jgi:hypothetical protein
VRFHPTRLRAIRAAVLIAAVSAPTLAWQPELEALSKRLVQKLASEDRMSVVVLDFVDESGQVTQLGRELAEELAWNLADSNSNLYVFPRVGQTYSCKLIGASAVQVSRCLAVAAAAGSKADVVIQGKIYDNRGNLPLELQIWKCLGCQDFREVNQKLTLSFREKAALWNAPQLHQKIVTVLVFTKKDKTSVKYSVTAGSPVAHDVRK